MLLFLAAISTFQVNATSEDSPTNDFFANRQILTGLPVEVDANNLLATDEPGEPYHMKQPPLHSLWYQWTAEKTQRVGLLVDPPWFAVVSVYRGDSFSNLVTIAGAKYSSQPLMFTAHAGRTYEIAVDTTSGVGPFRFAIVPAPANDDFDSPFTLQGLQDVGESHTTCATQEPGEPVLTQYDSRQSVWWEWKAPASGFATVRASSFNDYAPLLVLTGDRLSRLRSVQYEDYRLDWSPAEGLSVIATFPVQAETLYRIRATGIRKFQGPNLVTKHGRIRVGVATATLKLSTDSGVLRFSEPANVTLSAQPIVPEFGNPNFVDFTLSGLALVGHAQQAPWQFTFTNLSAGVYSATASGTNSAGEWQYARPIQFRVSPVNDDFENRSPFEALPTSELLGTFYGATVEPGEPKIVPEEKASMWFTWTAPATGSVQVTLHHGSLGIFRGDSLENLRVVKICPKGRSVFHAVANQTYQFKVSTTKDPETNVPFWAIFSQYQGVAH